MKLISWNVNGLRACSKKGLLSFIKDQDADMYCFQEIKITDVDLIDFIESHDDVFAPYEITYNCATKRKGYSGVLTLSKLRSTNSTTSIDIQDIDIEGRVVLNEFENIVLVNSYFPHSDRSLSRLDYKLYFNEKFLNFIFEHISKDKKIILTGDFNVAHEEIDLARPKQNIGNPGFTDEERYWFGGLLKLGYIDTFREINPNSEKYTWWSYRSDARARNIGWRIDYFLVSQNLGKNIKSAEILDSVQGSDHCPILLEIRP